MMHLLGSTIMAALVPLKSSIKDISSRLHTVEDTQNWVPGNGKGYPEDFDPADYNSGFPTLKAPVGGEECVDDYHTVSAPSRAEAEDAEMEDAHKRFESHNDNEDVHPFFEMVILNMCNQPRDEINPAHLTMLADIAAKDWDHFCSAMFLNRLQIPPSPAIGKAFLTHTRMLLVKLQLEDDLHRDLRADDLGRPASPAGPSFMGPFLAATQGSVEPDASTCGSAALDAPTLAGPPARLSEPISILSDGTKISGFTESSPPHAYPVGSALNLNTPPPGDGPGWKVMGGKRG